MYSSEAITVALALHAQPSRVPAIRSMPLPEGVTDLIRVAAGNLEAIARAQASTSETQPRLLEASKFFIEQILLSRECEADPWRVLGVRRGEEADVVQEHRRLLVSLVHPDRSDDWAGAYADRVHRAWKLLKDPEARLRLSAAGVGDGPGSRDARDWGSSEDRRANDVTAEPNDSATASQQMAADQARAVRAPSQARPMRQFMGRMIFAAGLVGAFAFVVVLVGSEDEFDNRELTGPASRVVIADSPYGAQSVSKSKVVTSDVDRIEPSAEAVSDLQTFERTASLTESHIASSEAIPAPAAPAAHSAVPSMNDSTWTRPAGGRVSMAGDQPSLPPAAVVRAVAPVSIETINGGGNTPVVVAEISAGGDNPRANSAAVARRQGTQSTIAESTAPSRTSDLNSPVARIDAEDRVIASAAIADRTPTSSSLRSDAGRSVMPSASAPTSSEALATLDLLVRRYGEGDIGSLMGLFASRRMADGGAAIAADYTRLFDSTRSRSLALSDLRWSVDGERLLGFGRYEASFRLKGRIAQQQVQGAMDFELIREEAGVRFARLDVRPSTHP